MNKKNLRLGQILVTPEARKVLSDEALRHHLNRHARGDWGRACDTVQTMNNLAWDDGIKIRAFSVYKVRGGHTIWVITVPDRTATYVTLSVECLHNFSECRGHCCDNPQGNANCVRASATTFLKKTVDGGVEPWP